MSVTRMAVFIGIWCSVLMASPLAANASEFAKYVGISDKGKTKVKDCGSGKGGTEKFANDTALNVELNIDLGGGDGLDSNDTFDAVFVFGGAPGTPLFSGIWSKIDERKGKETYQLAPSGDLAAFPGVSGWDDLLWFVNEQAGKACLKAPPENIYPTLSVLVKGTLVVDTNAKGEIDCPQAEGSCSVAVVQLDVKVVMDDGDDGWGAAKVDSVKFKYKGKGFVVLNNP